MENFLNTSFLFFFGPEDSGPILRFVSFEDFAAFRECLARSVIVSLGEGSEDGERLLESSLDVECERLLESLYHGNLLAGDLIFGSDEFVDEDGFFFPFDLDIIEFTENEELFCFLGDAFSDTDERVVDFVDSLESGGGVDGVTESGVFDFLSGRSDIADDGFSFIDPHAHTYLESVIFFELDIEFSDFVLLFDGGTAGEDGLFFFVSEGSPECHNRISFILIDESFFFHDDIRNFFEVDTQEVDEFFRLHIFGDTGKSGDIGEEARDGLSLSSELHFFVVFEDTHDEVFCEVLGEGAPEEAFSFFFPDVLVPRDENSDEEDDHHELDRMGEEFVEGDKIEDLSE